MVSINPNSVKLISLSNKERKALIEHSKVIEQYTLEKIYNNKHGQISLLNDEFERFLTSLTYEASSAETPRLQKIFNKLHQRLSEEFSLDYKDRLADDVEDVIEGRDFESMEELNATIQQFYDGRNANPDPEMGNLSPNQVSRLIYSNWGDNNCPLKFNKELNIEDLKQSSFFNNTRLFLNTLIEMEKENTATAKGNLNRKIVKILFDKLILDEDDRKFTLKYNKVINETDVFPLHIIRVVCELAGLIKKRSKKFYVVKKHQYLLPDEKAGELYYLLFYNYFRKFNIGYLDRLAELEGVQETIGYSLYMISKVCRNYQKVEKLSEKIFLPAVLKEINKNPLLQRQPDWVVLSRIIRPLEGFGLVKCQYKKRGSRFSSVEKVRKTKLFDRFVGLRL